MHSNTDLAAIPSAGRGEVRLELLAVEGIETGRARFERLTTDLVKLTRVDAREIAANPGDWGIDTFVGQLAGGSIEVWQSKYFIDGIAESQQLQIRESFHSARRKADQHGFQIDTWTLAIPTTMSAAIIKWWDGWRERSRRKYGIEIQLWQEADFRHILFRGDARGIRRHYFGASPDETAPRNLDLVVPPSGSGENLFAYAEQVVPLIGRDAELAELRHFVALDIPFAWWAWCGPAGSGKSRLALEFCHLLGSPWHAGFLAEVPHVERGTTVVSKPTLIVIDYAAQRAAAVSDFLLNLARTSWDKTAPVRVLILERSTDGAWWTTLQRLHRTSESADVVATMYALPKELQGVSEPAVHEIIRATSDYLGRVLSTSTLGEIADHVDAIDELRRPLFVTIATVDRLQDEAETGTRTQVLEQLLARFGAQLATRITSPGLLRQVRNLLTFASAVGGLNADDYSQLITAIGPLLLIPTLAADLETAQLDEILNGVEPDLVAELYVLLQVQGAGVESHDASVLLKIAAERYWNRYYAFVARAAEDHPEHAALGRLLDVVPTTTVDEAARWGSLACEVLTHLARPDHPLAMVILTTLARHAETFATEDMLRLAVLGQFRYANLWFFDDQMEQSNELFTEALASAQPEWDVYANILNNRGITWHHMENNDQAVRDYSEVIESPFATDESRACSLNNRADIYYSLGGEINIRRAIIDRSTVLTLNETTFNRRYIALVRRSAAWARVGDMEASFRDLETILSTPDIAMEQKMAARFRRARLILETDEHADARVDLVEIVTSSRNFEGVAEEAAELLASLPPIDVNL
jgi:tetratricopeptide (TPR) repeat protein